MKKLWSYALMAALSVTVLTGCKTNTSDSSDTSAATVETTTETADDEAASKEETSSENASQETSAAVTDTENDEENDNENEDDIEIEAVDQNGALIRVGSLKGPTSMGLVFLMEMSENGKTANDYEFTMVTAADELLPKVISGELDMALLPANVASVL